MQEKPTALRVLQTNKKKNSSPVIYLVIGFFAGILCSVLLFVLFFNLQTPSSNQVVQGTEEQDLSISANTKVDPTTTVTTATHHENNINTDEDDHFIQPESNELNNFFQHTAPAAAHSEQHASPFANGFGNKPVQPTPKTSVANAKNEVLPVVNSKTTKAATTPLKTATTTEVEPEIEAPQASVQIKVTQKPFAVNELK